MFVRESMCFSMISILMGGRRKIFCDCVDKLEEGGKSDKLNKAGEITVSGTIELEEYK